MRPSPHGAASCFGMIGRESTQQQPRYQLAISLRYVSPYAPFQIVMIIQALLHRALCLRYGPPYLKNNVLYFSYIYLNLNDIWLFA